MLRPIPCSLLALTLGAMPAWADAPRAVADIPPVGALVQMVLGDLGTAEVLLPPNADPHSFQLRPSQAALLASTAPLFRVGPKLTPWLDAHALEARPEGAVTPAPLLERIPGLVRDFGADHAEDEHDDHEQDDHADHAADDHGAHEHDAHDDHDTPAPGAAAEADHDHEAADHAEDAHEHHHHEGVDPHAWLDPKVAEAWLGLIAEDMATADPAHAETYRANARAAQDRIAALIPEVRALLAPAAGRPFVTQHAAYGYFAHRFDLDVAGAISPGDAAPPSAARLREVQATLRQEGVVCLFPEIRNDPARAALLIEGTDVRLGGALDPVGSALEQGPDLYPDLIRGMAQTLTACLKP
ncbi:zinc ABC transporter substrate-binding protein [Phaeovulum vinaykumarii]|uniref:High-affinity zinc uptake system protein ZnuA n=1 Tax=Phaeovulum vinaykumarii TaxID=407234 RepID=A0A1N7M1M2_9RHOB|nr:zinc ABC transporter substrate-binding protein [Phaeovulum vinaykumarii]SIS79831.1 zinc transport system substrate-binding protein [Phaeovulum vinaykumarii]SOC09552.1 zinc transport system substrate-binding protein [Phaeovulum vinaykumarii]